MQIREPDFGARNGSLQSVRLSGYRSSALFSALQPTFFLHHGESTIALFLTERAFY